MPDYYNELWLDEAAASFWELAGGWQAEADFESLVVLSLPLTIQRMPDLSLREASRWLTRQGCLTSQEQAELAAFERPLRACLVARGGARNYILLDSLDPPSEQNFSLAHEVAHFLLDYMQSRRQVEQRLSLATLDVLDGQRPPSLVERVEALLQGLALAPYRHFMERSAQGDILSGPVREAESRTDRLALELLAPLEESLTLVRHTLKAAQGVSYAKRLQLAEFALVERFGLPPFLGRTYARRLVGAVGGQETFGEWLKS